LYSNKQEVEKQLLCINNLLASNKTNVLEVGAVSGSLSIALAKLKFHVTALEESPVFFAVLMDRFAQERELRAFLTPLPLRLQHFNTNEKYDAVIASKVVSSMPQFEWGTFLESAYKFLSEGGFLVFDCSLKSKNRLPQEMQEIQKKVFGYNMIQHIASSSILESKDAQEVNFKFITKRHNRILAEEEEKHLVYFGNLEDIENILRNIGFSRVLTFSNWDLQTISDSSHSALFVAYV